MDKELEAILAQLSRLYRLRQEGKGVNVLIDQLERRVKEILREMRGRR